MEKYGYQSGKILCFALHWLRRGQQNRVVLFGLGALFGESHISFRLADMEGSLALLAERLGRSGDAKTFQETIATFCKDNQLGLLAVNNAFEKGKMSQFPDLPSSAAIRKLSQINGNSIEELEQKMKPGGDSGAGFLGRDEKLLDVLASDNNLVVGVLKSSHDALAKPLEDVVKLADHRGGVLEYNGIKFIVEVRAYRGMQGSPFGDGQSTNKDFEIRNLSNGFSIRFSGLLPHFIKTYGFYEGYGTSYRLSPESIIDVFPWLKR